MAKRNRKNVKSALETLKADVNEQVAPEVTAAPEEANPHQGGFEPDETSLQLPIEGSSAGETPQDVREPEEEPSADTGTEEQVTDSEQAPEDVEESGLNEQVEGESQTSEETKTEEPAPVVGRKSKLSDDAMVKVLFTENPQRKGTYSHAYNEKLMSNEDLTVKKAMELGIPRHHLLYLSKEGKIEVTNS